MITARGFSSHRFEKRKSSFGMELIFVGLKSKFSWSSSLFRSSEWYLNLFLCTVVHGKHWLKPTRHYFTPASGDYIFHPHKFRKIWSIANRQPLKLVIKISSASKYRNNMAKRMNRWFGIQLLSISPWREATEPWSICYLRMEQIPKRRTSRRNPTLFCSGIWANSDCVITNCKWRGCPPTQPLYTGQLVVIT